MKSSSAEVTKAEHEFLQAFDEFTGVYRGNSYTIEISENRLKIIGVGSTFIDSILKMESETLLGFEAVVRSIADTGIYAPSTLLSRVSVLERLVRRNGATRLDPELYPEWIESITPREQNFLNSFFHLWHSLGHPGVSDSLIRAWKPVRGSYKKSKKRAQTETSGWYTQEEYDDLVSAYWCDYETGEASLQHTVCLLLNAQYGRRPVQLAYLKIGDFEHEGMTNGCTGLRVNFPGVKDADSQHFRESDFETHPMSPELWELCQRQIEQTITTFESVLGRSLDEDEWSQLPFICIVPGHLKKRLEVVRKFAEPSQFFSSQIWHSTNKGVIKMLGTFARHEVYSERTGEIINQHGYRMRYTRARQLARLGVAKNVLLFWLGHENPKTLEEYYLDDPAERARKLDEKIAPLLAPLAQAFSGRIVDREEDAQRAGDPRSRIELDGRKGVGSCGEEGGFCEASVPIPCYRCNLFEPWLHGPHDEVLGRLIARQNAENNIFLPSKSRRMLRPLQLEKDIRAVKNVISRCEARKKELEGEDE